ncbi:MAG: tetratricopeptide repeat protein, partial [Candidatus Tectomicrobia bacterium]|nr:tetratricopeptide repeat protein [Candidatus Tectomicrobia bacterium]
MRRLRRVALLIAALWLAAGAGPAWSQTAEEWFRRGLNAPDDNDKIRSFSEALRLSPGAYGAYWNRGAAYYRRKLYDLAIADFTRAIQLRPNEAGIYVYRGNAYDDKGFFDLAVADYGRAIQLNPRAASAYLERGI